MKKLSAIIILGFLTIGLLAPVLTFAQPNTANLNECCKISSHFTAFKVEFDHKNGCVIGETSGSCYLNGKAVSPALPLTYGAPASKKCGTAGGTAVTEVYAMQDWGMICLPNTVYTVCNWIFYLMMIAVVIVFVIAGAKYMMSSGDAEKTKSAKGLIIYGIVGLVITLIAKLIPSVVKLIVGM